jgi:hypothetical protein
MPGKLESGLENILPRSRNRIRWPGLPTVHTGKNIGTWPARNVAKTLNLEQSERYGMFAYTGCPQWWEMFYLTFFLSS